MTISKLSVVLFLSLASIHSPAALAAEQDYLSGAFVRNSGAYRRDIVFASRLPTNELFIRRDGRILHAFPMEEHGSRGAWVVVESLAGAKQVFRDDSAQAIDWHEAWPGIDMQLRIVAGRTERVFRVAPGADPSHISLAFDGVRFNTHASGRLEGRAGTRKISFSAPIAFQDTKRGRVPIKVAYTLRNNGSLVGFRLGEYDPRLPLTIDPLLQSTYLTYGGQGVASTMAVDPASGDLIVSGYMGLGIPGGAAGGFQSIDRINQAYIARVDATLRRVIQATYIGGAVPTLINRVAVHPTTGEIYIAGETTAADYPGGGGGANPVLGGSRNDGFVSRFSPDLRQLLQTTFTGQSLRYVLAKDMAINATTGDVYVAGHGPSETFVLRFNRQLTSQLGRFILRGNSFNYASSLAINQATGEVYAAGFTSSTDLPGTAGGAESTYGGGFDAGPAGYVARLTADLGTLVQSTYYTDVEPGPLPNTGNRYSPLIAINPASGEVAIAGWCWKKDFIANGAIPAFLGGDDDVLVARLSADLKTKRGSTRYGGSGFEELGGIAFTPDGAHVYITGFTFSTDLRGVSGGVFPSSLQGGAFVARFSASLATLEQATYFNSLGNTDGYAVVVHPTTGEVYLGGQAIDGIAGLEGGVQPYFDSPDHFFGSAFLARFDALLTGGDDPIPDAFSFIDQVGALPGSTVVSAPIRIEGITVPAPVSVTDGEYSIDGGIFTASAGEVRRGQSIRVRHVTAAGAGVTRSTVLNVGSVADNFVSTTATGVDAVPAAFSLPARNPVAPGILVESAAITVTGMDSAAAISIIHGEYRVDEGAFVAASGTVNAGQKVVVRHRSAQAPATLTQTQLTIGGVSATFRSTTDPVDANVHPFQFLDVEKVAPDFEAASDPIVVMGINVPVPVSVVGGEWSTDGITFTSAPGTATNMTHIALRRRTGSGSTTTTVTLTVGDQSDDWILGQPQAGDTTPDPITFDTLLDAPLRSFVESNEVTISGVDVPIWINLFGAEYLDPVSGLWTSQGYLANGATTRLRLYDGGFPGATSIVRGKMGSADVSWEVHTTGGDAVPDSFDFVDRIDVVANTFVESNTVTVLGVIGDTLVTVNGCEVSTISGGYTSAPTRVANGTQLVVRLMSAATASTKVSCTIDIGGVTDSFSVTTAAASSGGSSSGGSSSSSSSSSSGGGASSGGASGGAKSGGGGSFDGFVLLLFASLVIARRGPLRIPGKPLRANPFRCV